jgi:hypothetical protein
MTKLKVPNPDFQRKLPNPDFQTKLRKTVENCEFAEFLRRLFSEKIIFPDFPIMKTKL